MRALFLLVLFFGSLADAATIDLQGSFTQGGLVFGKTSAGAQIFHDGQKVPVSSQGDFVIGFNRDAPPKSELVIIMPDGGREVRQLEISQRQYD
ncbi:MAG TPA: M23 family peptidase, partial [Thiolapillus brandeum]|nr:M23 family peptidase [Thiolapillus brandeum]